VNNPDNVLTSQIDSFIVEKRLIGYRYHNEEGVVRNFAEFVLDNGLPSVVSKVTAMQWVDAACSAKSRNRRISIIRQFALFLNRHGINAYVIPNVYRSIEHDSFCPYIYSKKELLAIFESADHYGQLRGLPYSAVSFPLIVRMLYGCGLRVSEALLLKVRNVDLRDGNLIIRDTKFFKDRHVPMHPNLTSRCQEYAQKILPIAFPDDWFFPAKANAHISYGSFYQYFRQLLNICDIRPLNSEHGPRVHDLRHTFAVHCLKKLDNAGLDMNTVLPILATYMGHTTYIGTGTYLHLSAELYEQVSDMVESRFGYLIPGGGDSAI